jgi:anti-sigma factor RsiW
LSDRGRLLTELAEYHAVYSRETVHLVEVPAADSDHLRQWLGRRVKTDLRIPDLRSAGLDFAGGRLTVVDGEPVAELMYRRAHGLPIALCVYLHAGPPRGIEITRRGDQGIADWQDGTHGYAVVGEADSEALSSMAALARRQL